ncbi:hypothetical protein [uncultured Corynebacterium sp.]|uniref:hypothetical protein n=1 Tax=uncultured Corynebacterium sp. TaxID=159447 RepID=UPI00262FA790|nr:hypothetical protein [uncultured Corynebacterium sp.]
MTLSHTRLHSIAGGAAEADLALACINDRHGEPFIEDLRGLAEEQNKTREVIGEWLVQIEKLTLENPFLLVEALHLYQDQVEHAWEAADLFGNDIALEALGCASPFRDREWLNEDLVLEIERWIEDTLPRLESHYWEDPYTGEMDFEIR